MAASSSDIWLMRSASACSSSRSWPDKSTGAKSSMPKHGRISMSESSSIGLGHFLTHSMASCNDATSHIQKPATNSFVSVNGPSVTVRFGPLNRTRAPNELGFSPSPAFIIPAFTSASLYFPMSASNCSLGSVPASELGVALTKTATFTVLSFNEPSVRCLHGTMPGSHPLVDRELTESTTLTDNLSTADECPLRRQADPRVAEGQVDGGKLFCQITIFDQTPAARRFRMTSRFLFRGVRRRVRSAESFLHDTSSATDRPRERRAGPFRFQAAMPRFPSALCLS
jgi:hypothetical protein